MFGCREVRYFSRELGYDELVDPILCTWGKIYNTYENTLYGFLGWEALFLKLSKNQPLIWVNFKSRSLPR